MARRRHLSRIAVMQVLFEREVRPDLETGSALARNVTELGEIDDEFASGLLAGVVAEEEKLKVVVQDHAPGWTLARMDPISRCALLIGTYELTNSTEAPAPVVINEAIEIAKEFGSDESGKFVNGVLNAIAQQYRAGEARPPKPAPEEPTPDQAA